MIKFSIEYNPYLVKCIFKKNGKVLDSGNNSRFGAQSDKRLQVIFGKSTNWQGLAEEIARTCNEPEIELDFRGRRIDFDDLKYCIEKYEGDTRFELHFEETKNDADMIHEIDILFNEIKKKNLKEFNAENNKGKDIFDAYEEVKNGIFEVSVIATMSSGKSTLINSLLHTEILPSENKACTATIAKILDTQGVEGYEATCYAADGKTVVYPKDKVDLELMKQYNSDKKVTYIDIEGKVPGISSNKIRLCLRDTPGPNNSRNDAHGELTDSIIKGTNAVVLYVMNATQFGIKDDKNLMESIANEMKLAGKQSRDRFIFVVNKCDELDEEKGETIDKMLSDVTDYLKQFGITEPTLIPTSARLALLVRKDREQERLTRKERQELAAVDDFVESKLLHFEEYATLTPTVSEALKEDVERYHADEETWDLEALVHTGVPAVEKTISEYIEKYAYPMKIKDAITDVLGILEDLDMKNKFEKRIAEDGKKLKKVREQIQEAREKHKEGTHIYNDYREKIDKLHLDSPDLDEETFKVEMELEGMTRPYKNKEKVDKLEADRLISEFQSKLEEYQVKCESELNREIDRQIFHRCSDMLEEYKIMVMSVLNEIKIEGYDFQKVSSLGKIKISDVKDIIKQNEQDRYRDETRWKDNPKRAGFFGFFKFWEPREISYTVQVKDGVDVNVNKVIVDIMGGFTKSMKANIESLFAQADSQVAEYKEAFRDNIENLDAEIGRILDQLDEDTKKSEIIAKRVKENEEKAKWVAEKEQQISSLLNF